MVGVVAMFPLQKLCHKATVQLCWLLEILGNKIIGFKPHWSELQKDIKKSPTLEVFKEEGCFETDGDYN